MTGRHRPENPIEIRCQHCEIWFPYPRVEEELRDYEIDELVGVRVACPQCGEETQCARSGMRHAQPGPA